MWVFVPALVVRLILTAWKKVCLDELLVINDELNNVFEKYDRYMTNRSTDERNLQNVVPDTEARSLSEQLGALQVHDAKKSPER